MAGGLYGGAGVAAVGLGVALVFVSVASLGPAMVRPVVAVLGAPVRRFAGIPGALGRQNAMRNPRRTSATAAALMIGVGLVGTITVLASSAKASVDRTIEQSFTGDIVIDSGVMGAGTLSPALAEQVASLPEVDAVMSLRVTTAEIDGDAQQVAGVQAATAAEMFDLGAIDGSLGGLDADEIALLEGRGRQGRPHRSATPFASASPRPESSRSPWAPSTPRTPPPAGSSST